MFTGDVADGKLAFIAASFQSRSSLNLNQLFQLTTLPSTLHQTQRRVDDDARHRVLEEDPPINKEFGLVHIVELQ